METLETVKRTVKHDVELGMLLGGRMELLEASIDQLYDLLEKNGFEIHAASLKYLAQSISEEVDRVTDVLQARFGIIEVETEEDSIGRDKILGVHVKANN